MPRRSRWIRAVLTASALASVGVAAWDLAMGGFRVEIFGLRLSSWEAFKPFRVGAVCAAAALWLHDRTTAAIEVRSALHRWAAPAAALASVTTALLAMAFGSFVAGASDAYGYVSQANMWASGQLLVHDPFVRFATSVGRAVAPLGYDLARTPGALVPTYAPGLPIAMAIASKVGGASGVYFVVPLLGAVAVWLTYVLGARVAGRVAGMIASVLFAFSPIFLNQAFEPMSDVPATAWWLLAWVFAVGPGVWRAFAAGVAAGAAVLTRPNLVPLSIVLACVVTVGPSRGQRFLAFACGVAPACAAIAALNAYWYGAPLRSGYGGLNELYGWVNFAPNLRNYAAWLVELHSRWILLAFLAPLITRLKMIWPILTFVALVLFAYLFYFVYDAWPFLRFMLPAIPLVLILVAAVIVEVVDRVRVDAGARLSFSYRLSAGSTRHAPSPPGTRRHAIVAI